MTTRSLLRLLFGLVLVTAAAAGLVAIRIWPHQVAAFLNEAVRTTRNLGHAGWLVAIAAQTFIALCGILPASVGPLTAGMLYGVVPGFLLAAIGTIAGALLSFLFTRSVFRPVLLRTIRRRPRFERLDEGVSSGGWRLVCLLRLSPIMPFALTSYALGLTSLGLKDYMIGTLAALPALLGYVVLGHLTGAGLDALSQPGLRPVRLAMLAVAIVTTALLTLRIGRIVSAAMSLPAAIPAGNPIRLHD